MANFQKLKILKQVDKFAQKPEFLLLRGSGGTKNYWRFYGSWIGFFISISCFSLCLFYGGLLISNMNAGQNDRISKEHITNLLEEENNNFSLNESAFMPSFELSLLNGATSKELLSSQGIAITKSDSHIVDYQKLRNYLRVQF